MKVIKRDGSIVEFNINKIKVAVSKAFYASQVDINEQQLDYIVDSVKNQIEGDIISIEDIQDLVENTLLDLDYEEVFKEYVTYRRKRTLSRKLLEKQSKQ